MALIIHFNTIVSIILIYVLFHNIAENIIILQTLPFEHPQILVMMIIVFNILKGIEYITVQLVFQYIPKYFKETALLFMIIPQFIQQLIDTVLIKVLWNAIEINYIIHNKSITKAMENLVELNYALTFIYALYILIKYIGSINFNG